MPRPSSQNPTFIPGSRLSRLPVQASQNLEEFYRDLFANTGPEHDRERLLQLLDLDVENGAAAQGRTSSLDHLGRAFRRIDAWTYHGDYLPQADRTELKRRVAHNLLAALPGLDLTNDSTPASPDHAILRQVQTENAAWRQGGTSGPNHAPNGRRPQASPTFLRQPEDPWAQARQPWGEQLLRHTQGPADALRRLGHGQPPLLASEPRHDQKGDTKTYWYVTPKPTACDKCLAMAGRLYLEKPERPHPNCKCLIASRELTRRQAMALQEDVAAKGQAIRNEHERIEREEQAAKIKAKTPAYVDDSKWNKDGDPVTVSGRAQGGKAVKQTFKGHVLPNKTKGGVAIKTKDEKTIDRRVTKEMSETLQTVLDDPRCKKAGITQVTISSTTDGQHNGAENRHYQGKAVDISKINGKAILDDPTARKQAKVMQEVIKDRANELNIKDNLGPNIMKTYTAPGLNYDNNAWEKHRNHVHIAII